jgi:hypothetical protein
LGRKTTSLLSQPKTRLAGFLRWVEAIFLAFADGATSAMAEDLATDISKGQDRITGHGSRRYSRHEYRVKNSEILHR